MRHLTGAGAGLQDWRDGAACRHHDPDLFFPEGAAGPALRQADRAKRVCETCPVKAPCLEFALRHKLPFGIWGGATGDERRGISRRLAPGGQAADGRDGPNMAWIRLPRSPLRGTSS